MDRLQPASAWASGWSAWRTRAVRGAALCALCCVSLGATPEKPGIYVVVSGLRSAKGSVRCGLYDDAKTWLDQSPYRGARAKIDKRKATCVFRAVEPGAYGFTVLHDEDDDGQMTKSALGLPEEGYAASRQAVRKGVGAPDWKDARFRYEGGVQRHEARVQYP